MEKAKVNVYGPGLPWIIVQKLTKEIIYEAIKAYIDDKLESYWLKLKLYPFRTRYEYSCSCI